MDKKLENRPGLRGFLGNEDGIMAVVFALLLPVFLVIAALAIDMGYAYWKRNTVQVNASASALAGAGTLMDDGVYDPVNDVVIFGTIDWDNDGVPDDPDSAVIWEQALLYAEKNLPGEDILADVDLHAGNWEPATRTFTSAGTWDAASLSFVAAAAVFDTDTATFTLVAPAGLPLNAVLALTRRAEAPDGPNNNPLPLFLAAAVGMPQVNINTVAIATVGAQTPIGFNGCIMALNPDEDASFYANGTNDIITNDCDIYINSDAACAADLIGNAFVEVGSDANAGMIYIAGDLCMNPNVVINCNIPDVDPADGIPDYDCPETGVDEQLDPFAYTYDDYIMGVSGMDRLRDLQCGDQYANNGSDYSAGVLLAASYTNPLHTGLGNFKINGQTFVDFCTTDPYLETDCTTTIMPPPIEDSSNAPIITGGKVVTNAGDWTYDETELRWEFNMVPGAYCGGIEARGNGTVVFAEGDYVLKGKEAVDPPIVGGPNPNEFDLRASVAIEGLNVAFYLADEYININWGGEADVSLIGRQSGVGELTDPLNGFLFYATPGIVDDNGDCISGCNEGPHFIRGTPEAGMQGILYFPMGDVSIRGTAGTDLVDEGGDGTCTILITDTVEFRGTTTFNADTTGCADFGVPPPGAELVMRMVH